MHCIEYGRENHDVVLLLHGGGLNWWNYREAAEALQAEFHVVLPVLDGHAGSGCRFTTIEANAARIIAHIDAHFGGSVQLIGGLSLGGQIALEILAQRPDICRHALIESALAIPSKLTYRLIPPAFGSCWPLIRQKWFARLQFRALHIRPELFNDYYRDTCAIAKADMIAFLQANSAYAPKRALCRCCARTQIFVGSRENSAMRRSAEIIHRQLPDSRLQVLQKRCHGEFSINHGADYADAVRSLIASDAGSLRHP